MKLGEFMMNDSRFENRNDERECRRIRSHDNHQSIQAWRYQRNNHQANSKSLAVQFTPSLL
jgi:hypothetical protein